MSAELVYKKTLEQLAESGSAEAKLALTIGESMTTPDMSQAVTAVCNCLKSAQAQLARALDYIGDGYDSNAESAVESARSDVTEALVALALK
jgi:hypothetical protein